MDGQSIALWAALVGLAAVLLDRRARGASGSGGGLTVRGADVSIDARNQVETSTVWRYNGPKLSLWYQDGTLAPSGRPVWVVFDLVPGKWYDRPIPYLGPRGQQFSGAMFLSPQTLMEKSQWDILWIPELLTVQEQSDAQVIRIPDPLAELLKLVKP